MTYLETGIYRLSTLSPIHIRDGALDYGEGFIRLNDTDDFLYVVDTAKLQAEIFVHGGIEAVNTYTEAFSNPNSETNIAEVLREMHYDYKSKIKKISKGIVPLPSGNLFMQSGLGQHFIPGSSIKGAIKTAVLYNNVKQQIDAESLNLNDHVEKKIKAYQAIKEDTDRENFKRRFTEELLQKAFQSQHPREYPKNKDRSPQDPGPFTDIFKAIKIKDAMIEKDQSLFAKVITSPNQQGAGLETLDGKQFRLSLDKIFENVKSLKRNEWIQINSFEERDGELITATFTKINRPPIMPFLQSETIRIFTLDQGNKVGTAAVIRDIECLQGETTIEISIDHEILKSFKRSYDKAGVALPFCDLKSLIKLCQDFAHRQWQKERDLLSTYTSGSINLDKINAFYQDDTSEKRATLRVGWGTGMLGTTVSLLLNETTRVKLRHRVISDGKHKDTTLAPRSRRFVLEHDQPVYPLGWIELNLLEEK